MTYALLIYTSLPPGSSPPPDRQQRALRGHREVQKEASARDALHAVAQLDSTSLARTVRPKENDFSVHDGPFLETKEWLVGFYLVDCDDEESALDYARAFCAEGDHAVEVRPVRWRWKK